MPPPDVATTAQGLNPQDAKVLYLAAFPPGFLEYSWLVSFGAGLWVGGGSKKGFKSAARQKPSFGIGVECNRLFYSFLSATGSGGGLLCKFFLHLAPMSSCSGDC